MAIWLLEGQSSQRDVIHAVQQGLLFPMPVLASHRYDRPEITGHADIALQEPLQSKDRLPWILDHAKQYDVSVILAGRATIQYEQHRAVFEQEGITLITGGLSVDTLEILEDKARFAQRCEQANIPVAGGWKVSNAQELRAVVEQHNQTHELCVKPVIGIYGEGFWRLQPDLSTYACFAHPDRRQVNTEQYIAGYAALDHPKPLLVMPYLSGLEYSIDIVCEQGILIAAVARCKDQAYQYVTISGANIELARQVVALFHCDGLINMQTKEDANGVLHVLEINARPSGGISYGFHAGLNLPALCFNRRLGWQQDFDFTNQQQFKDNIRVRPIMSSVLLN